MQLVNMNKYVSEQQHLCWQASVHYIGKALQRDAQHVEIDKCGYCKI